MAASILDIIVVISLGFNIVSGFFTGFIVQFARIFSIIAAFWAMRQWSGALAVNLTFIAQPAWRNICASVIIFLAVIFIIGILSRILRKIVNFSLGGWLDKICGALFGLVLGILIWTIIFIVLQNLFPNAEFLQGSRLLPWFNMFIAELRPWLPPELAKYFA